MANNFFAQKFGQQAQQQPPAPAPAPPSNLPWWATNSPQPVVQRPPALPQPVAQQVTSQQGEVHIGDLLADGGYVYTSGKAQSQRDQSRCPECGSGNYLHIAGQESRSMRCFDCGHNDMFSHSTAGASGIGQKNVAPPRPARVQTLSEGNFNPRGIVGRVS